MIAQSRVHLRRIGVVVILLVVLLFYWLRCLRQPQKGKHLIEGSSGISIELLTLEDEKLFAGEYTHPGFQLVYINALAKVAQMLVSLTVVMFILQDSFSLFCNPLLLGLNGLFKGQTFVANFARMMILGKGAVHWIAQQHNELDMRHHLSCTFRCVWIKQVGGTGFAGYKRTAMKTIYIIFFEQSWEMPSIPGHSPMKSPIKKMYILVATRSDRRMSF